jgi:cytochrome c5
LGVLRLALCACLFLLGGCNWMWEQPKGKAFTPSEVFADGVTGRTPPAGTVAQGSLEPTPGYSSGLGPQGLLTQVPIRVDLARGQVVYESFCAVCHGLKGEGDGVVVQRGFPQPSSFLQERLKQSPPGYFFLAATNGFGRMMGYASRIPEADRWAAVAYIKDCLQGQRAECPGGTHATKR